MGVSINHHETVLSGTSFHHNESVVITTVPVRRGVALNHNETVLARAGG